MWCGVCCRQLLEMYRKWRQCPVVDTWYDEKEGGDTGDALL